MGMPSSGDHGEDLEEVLLRGAVDLDLEEDPAERGLVEDLVGVEVGGEDDEGVEGHLELLARLEREDVARLLQGHDPAVDDLLRRLGLAAEVVDDEDAARGLELERRLVGARVGL
jgi:hypothetical protein